MKLYNTLTRTVEEFVPINPPEVKMYSCGMTVYDYAHIGHGRKYVVDDLLRRTLTANSFEVTHVQNVTDVGHLVSDADDGEDKMEKGARKSGKTVWEVAEFFTKDFYDSMDKLNVLRPHIIAKATEHIEDQINLVQRLIAKGMAYDTSEAVYFDIAKFPSYTTLFGQSLADKKVGVREEVETNTNKKNPQDFALWFKRTGKFKDHSMHWASPWGDGFPGWHIECSAMSMKYLGEQFDIHTGGEDHISIHHPNEIAQSEGATGKMPFVKYWIHTTFLLVDGQKMSKSLENFYTVADVEKKGFNPLALRYLYLTTHYRKQMNFTWASLASAQTTLYKLFEIVQELKTPDDTERTILSPEKLAKVDDYRESFFEAINNDLNTPQALAVVWEVIKSNIPSGDKLDLLFTFDEVLGLNLRNITPPQVIIPEEIKALIKKRDEARSRKDFSESDTLRIAIEARGFSVRDTSDGTQVTPKRV